MLRKGASGRSRRLSFILRLPNEKRGKAPFFDTTNQRERQRLLNAAFDGDLFHFNATVGFQAFDQVGAFLVVALDDRIFFALALGAQTAGGDAFADQISLDRFSAALGQFLVVFLGADTVRITGDDDVVDARVVVQQRGDIVQLRLAFVQLGAVEGKQFGGRHRHFFETWWRWWRWWRCHRRWGWFSLGDRFRHRRRCRRRARRLVEGPVQADRHIVVVRLGGREVVAADEAMDVADVSLERQLVGHRCLETQAGAQVRRGLGGLAVDEGVGLVAFRADADQHEWTEGFTREQVQAIDAQRALLIALAVFAGAVVGRAQLDIPAFADWLTEFQ